MDNSNGPVLSSIITAEDDIHTCVGKKVVDSVTPITPKNGHPDKAAQTLIVYGKRHDALATYTYPDVPDPIIIDGQKYASIWCPVEITIKLNDFTFFHDEPLMTTILAADGSYQQPFYPALDTYKDTVYNIETKNHAMFFASGIVVSDKETMKYNDIYGVGIGYKTLNGVRTDQISIIVYTTAKKPLNSIPEAQIIPKSVEEIPTDVVQGKLPVFFNQEAAGIPAEANAPDINMHSALPSA